MKRPDLLESLRNLLPAPPRLNPANAGTPLQFASSGQGGGDRDDPDDPYYDDYDNEPESPPRPTAARQRTVQTDPDDRYWTDYLRIALPVIGLLLVIAVFWFWAQLLIDNPDDDVNPTEPGQAEVVETATEPAGEAAGPTTATIESGNETATTPPGESTQNQETVLPTQTPTAPPTEPPANNQTGTDNQVQQGTAETGQTGNATETTPETSGDSGTGISANMDVAVTEALNLRSEATTDSEVITVLDAGNTLTVLDGPTEAEGFTWWRVVDEAGNQGWVVEEFIEPAS